MSRPRRILAAPAVCLLALSLSSCTQSVSTPLLKPVRGGSLRITIRDLSTLDPARASGRGSQFVLGQIFDPLTRVDPAGNVIPAAATSWTTSSDGKTWTFHLGSGRFHDGSPVTAYDFKFAFDRITSKALGSDFAFQLEPVSGFRAARIDGTAAQLSGVSVVNVSTLQIRLDYPFYELPTFLAHPALGPVSQKVFNRNPNAFGDSPVGNGPFKVSGTRSNTGVKLARFDDHAGSTPYLDGIDCVVNADAGAGWRAYLAGSEDVAEVPAADIVSGKSHYGTEGFTPNAAALYYGPNLRMQKFQNPVFRRALSLAIDRANISTTVYGGTKFPATGIIPRGIPGYESGHCDACTHDLAQAQRLITQAFGSSPPPVRIDHLDASPSRDVASAIAANLREVGLTVTLQSYDSSSYLKLLQSKNQELAELGWLADVPTPDGFLAQQLRSGSPNNQVGYSDALFDRLIDQARANSDATARRDAYQQAEARALNFLPLIPIVWFRNHVGIAPRVHGLYLNGAGSFDASTVWLTP